MVLAQPRAERRLTFRDAELQAAFERRGYVVVPCIAPRVAEALARTWRELASEIHEWPFSASVMSGDQEYRLAVSRAIGRAFRSRLDALFFDYRFSFGNFVVKRAATPDTIPVHQDATFVDESVYESAGLWVPLTDVHAGNGCLRVVPGSHRLNRAPRGTDRRFPYAHLVAALEERYLVDVEVPAGYALVFNQRLFHASHPNRSPADRICAAALAVPAEASMYYLYQAPQTPEQIDVYRVDDAFYRVQVFAAPPRGRMPIATIAAEAERIDERDLALLS